MRSKNLFLKPRASFQGRWLLAVLLLAGLFLFFRAPRQSSLDDFPWQPPIEPKTLGTNAGRSAAPAPAPQASAAALPSAPAAGSASAPSTAPAAAIATPPAAASQDKAGMEADATLPVRETLARWSHAWSSRDVNAYLSVYARTFTPEGGMQRQVWEQTRRQRILSKTAITHEMRNVQIVVDDDKATVRFEQTYVADSLRSVGPKVLRLERFGQEWLIVSETSN